MGSEATAPGRPRIGRRGIAFPPTCTEVVDVLLDGIRVFSVDPGRGRPLPGGHRRTGWPPALAPYLHGTSTVTLRAHLTGEVLASREVRFSADDGRVRVVDDDGVALALNKWGKLERPFEQGNPDREVALDLTAELLADLHDLGLSAFVAYGTLLGAVREGRLIAHDTDMDVAYYSRHEHPADVMRESFAVQRKLAARGWRVVRRTGAMLQVRRAGAGARSPKIDVFTAYHCDGWFVVEKWVRGRLPRSALLPLGEVALEGRTFPAPGEPEALLTLTYGEGWRVPDPTFTFHYSGSLRRRSEAWFGGWRRELVRWREVHRSSRPARGPSSFARYVDARTSRATTVVDVGCGTGTDAVWLARDGRRVVGLDYVPSTLARARQHARRQRATARFETLSLYDLRAVLARATQLALAEPDVTLSARLVLNALHPDGRSNLWLLAKIALGGGGLLHLELLTGRRADGSPQPVEAPFVTGLDPDEVVAEVTERGGRVVHRDDVDDEGRRVCRLAIAFAGQGR